MDLYLTDEQQQLTEAFADFFAKESPPTRVRETEESGFDAPLWQKFLGLGGLEMGVPEEGGNSPASLVDLALVAEEQGRQLAPIPFIESIVALRLLGRSPAGQAVRPVIERATSGQSIVTFAPRRCATAAARLVPGGAIADHVVALTGTDLVMANQPATAAIRHRNLGSMALADVDLTTNCQRLANSADAKRLFAQALEEWKVLTAALQIGLASRSLEIGVEYVKQRQAFGVPIGAFQAVAHRLADIATTLDGARLLVRKAAWAAEHDPDVSGRTASMAWILAGQVAKDASSSSLHFHGGYGFMLEYDIQLYYRRARAWTLVGGDPNREYQHLADLLYGPARGGNGL